MSSHVSSSIYVSDLCQVRGAARTPIPAPIFKYPMEME